MLRQVICKECERSCIVYKEEDNGYEEFTGNECEVGIKYAQQEINNNKGTLTTLVRIKGANCNVIPVKSKEPIDKKLWIECSKALSRIYVGAPAKIGDVVCKNILNTGVDIICAKNIDKLK